MSKIGLYFIKVPAVSRYGRPEEIWALVNPSQLHIGILTTFWEKLPSSKSSSGMTDFYPAYGVESAVKLEIDTTEIIETLNDLKDQICCLLRNHGSEGDNLCEVVNNLKLEDLIQSLAKGDINAAKSTIQDLMYTLMGALPDMAARLHEQNRSVVNLEGTVSECIKALNQDERQADMYLKWEEKAKAVVEHAHSLRQAENGIHAFLERTVKAFNGWEKLLSEHNDLFQETLDLLDPSEDGATSFACHALLCLSGQGSKDEMRARINNVNAYLDLCHTCEHEMQAEYDRLCQDLHNEIISQEGTALQYYAELALRDLHAAQQALRSCEDLYQGYPNLSLSSNDPRVKELYAEALEYLPPKNDQMEHEWRVGPRRDKLRRAISRCNDLLHIRPRLPENLRQAMAEAEDLIKQLEKQSMQVSEPEQLPMSSAKAVQLQVVEAPMPAPQVQKIEAAKPPKAPTAEVTVTPVAPNKLPAEEPAKAEDSQSRLELIYEQALCIGYTTTIVSDRFFSTTSPVAVLAILVELGKITRHDERFMCKPLTDLMTSKCEWVDDLKSVMKRRDASALDWIHHEYKNGSARWKLTKRASQKAAALLTKYHLTCQGIEAARKKIREFPGFPQKT